MAVYEHTYKPYAGTITPLWSRFLVIPRHIFGAVFQSKLFIGFFAFCYVPPLIFAILIYLRHNLNALSILNLKVSEVLVINPSFFLNACSWQQAFAFLLTVIVGPILISRDLTNNALPLYLCRPFSRFEYVLGKASVLVFLLSAVTWVPVLILFFFQAGLEGGGWLMHNLWVAGAIFLSSMVWIALLTLLALALSAWVKWRIAASGLLFALFLIPRAISLMINALFRTGWGTLISIYDVGDQITMRLFGESPPHVFPFQSPPPLVAEWFVVFLTSAVCLLVLSMKIRAYEVSR
jgi:ABC-2 type transport system permease protein